MKTKSSLKKMKTNNEKITMITAYDYPSGKFAEEAGIDMILVGDSLGMVVLGYENTLNVTIDDIVYHCKATRRGAKNTFIVADMPYMSYHLDIVDTKKNAAKLILEGKANAVKLEGGSESRLQVIKSLIDVEIPVIGHLGLTPQSINTFGGFKIQGNTEKSFNTLLEQSKKIQDAGAFLLVLEGIPELLGKTISEELSIPTIGIGAGRFTDGQVLVYHDILGITESIPKFVKKYESCTVKDSIKKYIEDVKEKKFPAKEHIYFPIK